MSATEKYLANNRQYAVNRRHGALPAVPSQGVAVVACMDARMDLYRILGLGEGEAHVICNAGGVVTADVLRSLLISQRLLGTKEVILINHTECGMLSFKEDDVKEAVAQEVGEKPSFSLHAFSDLVENVRDGLRRIRNDPFLKHRNQARGFIFDVVTGQLSEVT